MRSVRGRGDLDLPIVGQGTWRMGEDPRRRADEVRALQCGLDLGLFLIDTAEMYGDGGAERIVGEAIRGRREEVFLVSKVLPYNASRKGTLRAAEQSLERLGTERLDLYLLHWPGSHPLEETYAAFEQLVEEGKIRHHGVSNFDLEEMNRSEALPQGRNTAVNQVLYNLERRGIEPRILPWCRDRGVIVMAYSPFEQARLSEHRTLERVAARRSCTRYQAALAWTVREPGVVAIPKATDPAHVRENAAAAEIRLDAEDLAELDAAFPPPRGEGRLEML